MTYAANETSEHEGSKVFLYRFSTFNATREWFYTTDARPWTIDGNVYAPYEIKHDELQQGTTEESAQRLTISVPFDNEVAVLHVPYLPPRPVSVTIYSVHRRDGAIEVVQGFTGQITNFAQKGEVVDLQASQIIDSLQQNVPYAVFKSGCIWSTYEVGCGVPREDFTTEVNGGLAIAGDTITAAAIGVLPAFWFRAGVAENPATGESRFIVEHTADLIRLSAPFTDLDADSTLLLYAGDDFLPETCRLKFNNKINYTGFDHFPIFNIFEKGSD